MPGTTVGHISFSLFTKARHVTLWILSSHRVVLSQASTELEHACRDGSVNVANNVSFVPLCTVSLSLLEGGANGIDDTATQFAEVRADRRDSGGRQGGEGGKEDGLQSLHVFWFILPSSPPFIFPFTPVFYLAPCFLQLASCFLLCHIVTTL